MVGTLVKWRLSWIALVALSLFAVWGCRWVDELGNNSGQREQRLIDVVMAFNYSLPLVGFFWFRHLLKTSSDQKAKSVLWSGWGVLLVAGVALFLLYQVSPHQQTPSIGALELWRLSSNFIWLMPLGVWAIARSGGPQPRRSLIYATSAAVLAVVSFILVQLLGWDAAKTLGPVWGFAFVVEILLLCAASAERQPKISLAIATIIVAIVAGLLRFLIFFAGVFYGGGMFQSMFIALIIAVVFLIELLVTRFRHNQSSVA